MCAVIVLVAIHIPQGANTTSLIVFLPPTHHPPIQTLMSVFSLWITVTVMPAVQTQMVHLAAHVIRDLKGMELSVAVSHG